MKSEDNIYKLKKELEEKKALLSLELNLVTKRLIYLQEKCPHTIVFKFNDHLPHDLNIDLCYCPACSQKENIYDGYEIDETSFKNSKVIDLTDLHIREYIDIYEVVQNEVFSHYEYYYNINRPSETLSETMEKIIKVKANKVNSKKLKRRR